MDIKQIDHIGIAVKNIDESLEIYKLLGFKCVITSYSIHYTKLYEVVDCFYCG